MTPSPYTGAVALAREAMEIAQNAPHRAVALPPLLVLTDPDRLPDPVHLARYLPVGCALIYRHFGDSHARQISAEASSVCTKRGLVFLVSCDSGVPPDPETGVHFPEHLHGVIADWHKVYPNRMFTAAAHSQKTAERALAAGADAVLLSPVFDSNSPSAGCALGAAEFTKMAGQIDGPVYALGGINANNAHHLRGSAAGLAVVSGVLGA